VVQVLLKHKADVDAEADGGWTALREAARNGHKAVVRLLKTSKELP
jgi:ankyrin repeat protein